MKKLLIAFALCATVGCAGPTTLRMMRTVPADQSTAATDEMVEQIERDNRFAVEDVNRTFVGNNKVQITVTAVEMSSQMALRRSNVKLQNENIKLSKKVKDLEARLADKENTKCRIVPLVSFTEAGSAAQNDK